MLAVLPIGFRMLSLPVFPILYMNWVVPSSLWDSLFELPLRCVSGRSTSFPLISWKCQGSCFFLPVRFGWIPVLSRPRIALAVPAPCRSFARCGRVGSFPRGVFRHPLAGKSTAVALSRDTSLEFFYNFIPPIYCDSRPSRPFGDCPLMEFLSRRRVFSPFCQFLVKALSFLLDPCHPCSTRY